MRTGKKYVKGTFSADVWLKIYETTLATSATTITISGLDGNTDEEYIIRVHRFGIGVASAAVCLVRLNNDSGNNYNIRQLYGSGTSKAGYTYGSPITAMLPYGSGLNLNQHELIDMWIYAKSGYDRIMHSKAADSMTDMIITCGHVWNNSADNITSIVLDANTPGGFYTNTNVQVYAKRSKL